MPQIRVDLRFVDDAAKLLDFRSDEVVNTRTHQMWITFDLTLNQRQVDSKLKTLLMVS